MEFAFAGLSQLRLAFSWVLFACDLTLLVLWCEEVGIAEVSCLPQILCGPTHWVIFFFSGGTGLESELLQD